MDVPYSVSVFLRRACHQLPSTLFWNGERQLTHCLFPSLPRTLTIVPCLFLDSGWISLRKVSRRFGTRWICFERPWVPSRSTSLYPFPMATIAIATTTPPPGQLRDTVRCQSFWILSRDATTSTACDNRSHGRGRHECPFGLSHDNSKVRCGYREDEMAHRRRYSECSYLGTGLVRRAHTVHIYSNVQCSEPKFSCRCRQKNTRKGISWSARAASRWILEKLKEDKEHKVLRVQASNETLEGSGSKNLVGGIGYSLYH